MLVGFLCNTLVAQTTTDKVENVKVEQTVKKCSSEEVKKCSSEKSTKACSKDAKADKTASKKIEKIHKIIGF